jgi:hypothetical protein
MQSNMTALLLIFQVSSTTCILLDNATKLLSILIADIVLVNGISIVWALVAVRVRTRFWSLKCCRLVFYCCVCVCFFFILMFLFFV